MWRTCLGEEDVDINSACDASLSRVGLMLVPPENVCVLSRVPP